MRESFARYHVAVGCRLVGSKGIEVIENTAVEVGFNFHLFAQEGDDIVFVVEVQIGIFSP